MCVRWQPAAYHTWLFGNRFDVLPVSNAAWLWSRQKGLIDAGGRPLLCSALVPMICSSRLLRFRHSRSGCGISCKGCQSRCEKLFDALGIGRGQTVLRL